MLSSVSSSSTITLHLLNRHQTLSHGDLLAGGGGDGWGTKGCCLPRDHVSTDLHYNTIKRLVSSSKVREKLRLTPPSFFPSIHFCNAILLFLIKTSHPLSEVYSDILFSVLLLYDQGYYFQGLLEAERTDRG